MHLRAVLYLRMLCSTSTSVLRRYGNYAGMTLARVVTLSKPYIGPLGRGLMLGNYETKGEFAVIQFQ